jgi:ribosomal protein L12E/L44/L45/RPP1/RPP2
VSIAVELTGLGDTDIDELIYATDVVAPTGAPESTETSAPASQKQTAEQEPAEVAAAQGA